MCKKAIFTIVITLLVAALVAAVCLFPWPVRIDKTLTMTKLDAEGNELGTFDVHFQGKALNYLLREDLVLLEIDPFDGMKNIRTSDAGNAEDGLINRFGKEYGQEYCQLTLDAMRTSANANFVFLNLYFTEALDCFALVCHEANGEDFSYVASASGQYTTREIVEYFNGLVPGK